MKVQIIVGKKKYPCRPTLGAMLRFKRETGKEVTEIENGSISDLTAYLYCCIKSASKADGVDFDYSLEDFADALMPADLEKWTNSLMQDADGRPQEGSEVEKKS